MKQERTYEQLAATILINEVEPRVKKVGLQLKDICSETIKAVCVLEYIKFIDRKTTRQLLDNIILERKANEKS